MEYFRIDRRDNVAIMVWTYEDQNRFTAPFLTEILSAYDRLEKDESVSAVVVTGAQEKYFSTGMHLEWLMAQAASDFKLVEDYLLIQNQFLIRTAGFRKPMVGALNGHTVGMGAIIAACMDYRLMVADRGFVRLPEVQIDIPFTPGMTAIFKDILPAKSFRDMGYTGDRFTSAQAKEMGYVDELFPAEKLMAGAVELAVKLGLSKSATYAEIKRGMRRLVIDTLENIDPGAIKVFVQRMKKNMAG